MAKTPQFRVRKSSISLKMDDRNKIPALKVLLNDDGTPASHKTVGFVFRGRVIGTLLVIKISVLVVFCRVINALQPLNSARHQLGKLIEAKRSLLLMVYVGLFWQRKFLERGLATSCSVVLLFERVFFSFLFWKELSSLDPGSRYKVFGLCDIV